MRSDGDGMIGWKASSKLIGVSVMIFCATLVCTMFLNYLIDISALRPEIVTEPALRYYEAQVSTAKVVCLVTGGCLLLTTIVMLFFYIRHYIDTHKRELGVLKALGYSAGHISLSFRKFGSSVLIGDLLGVLGAFLLMPKFYELQNKDHILPELKIHVHPLMLLGVILLPTLFFAGVAVISANSQLQKPVLCLLKDMPVPRKTKVQKPRRSSKTAPTDDRTFLQTLKRNTLKQRKMLIFFIVFAAFCFSAMTQMSFSMDELSSPMMGTMILLIGLLLAFTTLLLALTSVLNGNRQTVAMMRVFGYTQAEISRSLLGIYRPLAYIGFAVGSVYQYVLLKIMVDIVFRDIVGVPEFHFRWREMFISLALFILFYEITQFLYSKKLRSMTVKAIMTE